MRRLSRILGRRNPKETDEQAPKLEVQNRPPHGREYLGAAPRARSTSAPMVRGQHGQRRAKKLSDYGTQLQAKQKLKGYYGNITERQIPQTLHRRLAPPRRHRREHDRPGSRPVSTPWCIVRNIRADVPFAARQLVGRGHVRVNGRRVTDCVLSGEVDRRAGASSPKAKEMALVLEASKSAGNVIRPTMSKSITAR